MVNRVSALVSPKESNDANIGPSQKSIRPDSLDEFIGQPHLKSLIRTSVKSARQRNAPFPHSLITGAAGLGKTSVARLISSEMQVGFVAVTAESLEDSTSVKGLLSRLNDEGYDGTGQATTQIRPTVLFLDEAHRLPRQSQELLYSCIEDRIIDTRVRDPLSGLMKPVREWVPFFTLIAATNRPGDLTTAFRDRLRLQLRLEVYDERDSAKIARNALAKMGIKCGPKSAALIAARGRGVPRKIISICEQIRDISVAGARASATPVTCEKAFHAFGIDPLGLMRQDAELLRILAQNVGQPLGLKTISSLLGEDERAVEEDIEPYLIGRGLIQRTQRGRAITPTGLAHLREHHGYESNGRAIP